MFQTFLTAYDLLSMNGIPMNWTSMCIHTSTCFRVGGIKWDMSRVHRFSFLWNIPYEKSKHNTLICMIFYVSLITTQTMRSAGNKEYVYTMFQLFLDVRTSNGTKIYFTRTIAVHRWHVSRRHENTTSFIHYADMQFLGILLSIV